MGVQLNNASYEGLIKNFNKKPTIAFSLRPIPKEKNKICLSVVGRAPTTFSDSQGSHTFAICATFKALELMLQNVTVEEAVDRVCAFHSIFLFLYRASYGENPCATPFIVNAGAIINELGNGMSYGTISKEMKCPYIQEYLTICAYILNHLPETSIKLEKKSLNKGEGKALDKLVNMRGSAFNSDVLKDCLAKLIDSDAVEEFIKTRKNNNLDVVTIIFHQIIYIHCLLQGMGNLYSSWLPGINLLTVGKGKIPSNLKKDLRNIIFSKSANTSSNIDIERDNLITEALVRINEYSELEAWHASKPNYRTYDL